MVASITVYIKKGAVAGRHPLSYYPYQNILTKEASIVATRRNFSSDISCGDLASIFSIRFQCSNLSKLLFKMLPPLLKVCFGLIIG